MALPRQAAQTAAPGATSALRKPEPEPSRGRRRCGSSRRFPGRVGITERGVLMPRTAAAGPSPHPTGPAGSRPRARAVPGGFGDAGMAGACSPCRARLTLALLKQAMGGRGGRLGGADEAGPKPCTDGALHHPGAMTGTRGAPGMGGPSTGHAAGVVPCVDKPQTRSLHTFQEAVGWSGGCWCLHSVSRARITVLGSPLNPQLPESADSVRLNQSPVNIPSLCHGGCQGGEHPVQGGSQSHQFYPV